jgi:hypothetical protein
MGHGRFAFRNDATSADDVLVYASRIRDRRRVLGLDVPRSRRSSASRSDPCATAKPAPVRQSGSSSGSPSRSTVA